MDLVFSALQDLGHPRKARKNSLILSEGDSIRGFIWLRKGSARVYQMSSSAKELEVVRFQAGQWIAPAIAFSAERFPYYLQALEPCEYLFFPKEVARERIIAQPALARFFLHLLADRCQALHQRLHALQFQTLRERVLQYFLQECKHDGACQIRIPMSKKELAGILGVTAEALSRSLCALQEEGIIQMDGRSIKMLQCNRSC